MAIGKLKKGTKVTVEGDENPGTVYFVDEDYGDRVRLVPVKNPWGSGVDEPKKYVKVMSNAKFKVGDKVKFKNLFKPERGEETGVVTGYDTDGSVLIRDDDGIKVKASEKLVRLANSVRNARLKVGDRVKVTWNPDGQKKGIVGKTGELLRISSEGTALVDIDGHEYFTDRAYLTLANSVCNAKYVKGVKVVSPKGNVRGEIVGVRAIYQHGFKDEVFDVLLESGPREGEVMRSQRESEWEVVNSVRSTNAVVAKAMAMNASDPYLGEKLKLMIAHEAVSVSGGGKPSAGDVVFEYRGKKYYIGKDNAHMVKQFADAGLVKMVNSKQKNESEIKQIEKAIGRKLTDEEFWIVGDRIFDAGLYGGDREIKAIISELKAGKQLKSRSKNHVHNSVVAKALNAVACNAAYSNTLNFILRSVKPYMDRRIKGDQSWEYPKNVITVLRKVCDRAVMSAGRYDGKRPPHRIYSIECEKDGFKFMGNLIVTGLLHRDDPDDVSAFDEYDMTISLMYVGKAINAVRNAWADAPDAATAKRDIEQTVRKAAEIAKKRSGAKATYKMTPNDNFWCGYIELTFNTEEEAKKYNPYYLFDELGDNKSILPKWSWAISSFNYQKNGKVVKIFVGRLAT